MATCMVADSGSDQITQLCNLCKSSVSDGYCDECGDYMCRPCFDLHSRARTCRHHVLLDDLSENSNKKTSFEPCKRHQNQSIKYHCIGDEVVGCVECFFTEHRNCQHQNIEDAAKTFKDSGEETRLKREIQRLENVHSEYTEQVEQDQETATVINNAAVDGVMSFKDKFTSYVAAVEELALETAERLRLENETQLEKRVSELDSVGEELELCMMKLENPESADQLFIAALEIKPTVESIRRRMSSLGNQNVVTKYEFQPNKHLMEMIQESRTFGEVCILSGDKNASHQVDQVASETKSTIGIKEDTVGVHAIKGTCEERLLSKAVSGARTNTTTYTGEVSPKSRELPEPLMFESSSHHNQYEFYFMGNTNSNVLILRNTYIDLVTDTSAVLVLVDQIQEKKGFFKSKQTVGSVLKGPGYGCGFKFVLHAVYPYDEKRKPKIKRETSLAKTVTNVLKAVDNDQKIDSVAIPIFGIDSRKDSELEMFSYVVMETYRQFCQDKWKRQQYTPLKVMVVCHEHSVYKVARRVFEVYVQLLKHATLQYS